MNNFDFELECLHSSLSKIKILLTNRSSNEYAGKTWFLDSFIAKNPENFVLSTNLYEYHRNEKDNRRHNSTDKVKRLCNGKFILQETSIER
jgi:hypothetical protein